MIRLRKYLKPFAISFIIAVLLLFTQAICDLNLPNFMSDIVNVGIQQNGIESGAPDAISKKGYEFLKLFMTDSDKKELDSIYTVRTAHEKNADGKEYITLYSKMSDFDTIYVLSDKISDETKSKTERIFGNALWAMMNVLNSMSEQNGASESKPETTLDKINIDELYKIQPVIEKLPQKAIDDAIAKADKIDDMLVSQSAVKMVGALYDELGVDVGATQSSYIIKIGSIMLLIALGSGLATIAVTFLSSKIATGVAKNLRNDIFEKVENFSNAENDKFSTASLITRCTNDVSQIQMLLQMGIRMICYAPIMAIGGVIMALNKSVSMAWIIAAACIFLIGFMMVVFFISLPKFKNMQKLIDKVNLIARENLNGLMVIKAFGTRKFEEKRFDDANRGLAKNTLFINRVMSVMMPTMMLMMYSVTIIVIWVGSHYVAESAMQIGDMMAFMQYAMQIIMSFLMISMMFIFIPRASVSAERIADILETKPIIVDPKNPLKMLDEKKGYVEFNDVSFKYDGAEEYALHNISFTAKPGQTTAFIGSTGSGKTTLANLILRFYDTTEGEIKVGGVNVKSVTQNELRKHIGYVPQKSVLMSGTVESNINYGNEKATHADVEKAATIAQAKDFIVEKAEAWDSEISQGGSNVSGGQRQRLSIARALAVNPDIFIFDDSFSALDFKTDAALRAALSQQTNNATVIIIAQRVSTIINANCIYVLDNGQIIGSGTHKELLKNCDEYVQIASTQLSKEELDNEQ